MPEEKSQKKSSKPVSFRLGLFLFLGIFLIGAIWYGYYWFTSTQNKLQAAETSITKAEAYDSLSENLQKEYQRCQAFIAQEQGEFGEFQYCQGFIRWVNNNTTTN